MESMHIKTEESIRSLPFGDGHNVEMTNTPINSHGGGPLGGMPGQGPVYNGVGVAGVGAPIESNGGREVGGVIPHMARYQIGNGGGMADPALQECLSPFFQPFGVDVSHFPLTNPPIFQSSLTNFSDHPRPVSYTHLDVYKRQVVDCFILYKIWLLVRFNIVVDVVFY